MPTEFQTITLSLPLRLGNVNCYLLQTGRGFVLIDTGVPNRRVALEKTLLDAGCEPGTLELIVLTHGDFDHSGNAAYLGKRFGATIAAHRDDAPKVEQGDMFLDRAGANWLIRKLTPLLFGFGKEERFSPHRLLEDGDELTEYGLEARVLSIPGHSKGSIGVLTADGLLFGGDLFENTQRPVLNSLQEDPVAARASAGRLRGLGITTVYPGHGAPFALDELVNE